MSMATFWATLLYQRARTTCKYQDLHPPNSKTCRSQFTMLTSRLGILQKKPYSAVTVQIDRLTSEQYDADDMSGIPDLIEVVRLQIEGPTEAARAIRKKLYETLDEI